MITTYIVDLIDFDPAKREQVFDRMHSLGETGAAIKAGTQYAYMFCSNISVADVSAFLGVDVSRITDATGWDMIAWIQN